VPTLLLELRGPAQLGETRENTHSGWLGKVHQLRVHLRADDLEDQGVHISSVAHPQAPLKLHGVRDLSQHLLRGHAGEVFHVPLRLFDSF
jgi:hypothetical protein